MADLTPEDIKRVKAMGFLKNTTNEGFSMRVITKNGVLKAEQWRNLSEVAAKWGNGTMSVTTRMTVELPGIRYEDIPTVQEYIAQEDMLSGGTGPKIRPVAACKGTVCQYGNCDTQGIAERIHDRFFVGYEDVVLPHKFKVAVGGCPNNCVKPNLNDFGMVGIKRPNYQRDLCFGCKNCSVEAVCPMGAPSVTDRKMDIDEKTCVECGRCVGKCRFKAIADGEQAFAVYIGGRWGKQVRHGTRIPGRYSESEALDLLEKCILLFRDQGKRGERFGVMIDRLGEQTVMDLLLGDTLLARKEEILQDKAV